jgi:hypothetical protein
MAISALPRVSALAAALGLSLLSAASQATVIFQYGACNPSDGCDQSVNFSPANDGTTVVGDTNPPKPKYQVFADSPEGLTLHGSGSTVDTGVHGPGFNSIVLRPEQGYAWTAIEFMLDSINKDQPLDSSGLKFTAMDQHNVSWEFNANFPWEGNKGENQHYHFHALNGESMVSLRIDYHDPLSSDLAVANRISDIHNIDVNTAVPEPSSLALFGLALVPGMRRLRKRSA